MSELVLVTGASGYLASHCVAKLLDAGYRVRGTVRSLNNKSKIHHLINLPKAATHLTLVEGDLTGSLESWIAIINDCDYVLHVASPFPIVSDESVIKVAVDGTMVVLKAANKCLSVKKVVLTSSCAAINEGHNDENRIFNESDWSNVESPKMRYYAKSKTLAEKAAWDYVNNITSGNKFPLTCLNPTLIVGPLLSSDEGASVTIIKRFLSGEMPALPSFQMGFVDVRDVAEAHIIAMTSTDVNGERILLTDSPSLWFKDVADCLRPDFSKAGYKIPRFQVPYILLWIYSFIDPQTEEILDRIDREVKFDNSKGKKLLGRNFSDSKNAIIEMAHTLIENGVLPMKRGYKGRPTNNN
uniref:Epimerase domain-containing protein n=1 Tax=Parastrongyloides trichosuri TaxID=131310 RepID=A0A0N4ZWY6_PARTI